MIVNRKTALRLIVFWGVVGLCIWYLLSRWAIDARPPWAADIDPPPPYSSDSATDEEWVRDLPVIVPIDNHSGDYFIESRLERERARSQQLEWLKSIAGDDRVSADARQRAGNEAVTLVNLTAKEAELEGLIRGKGFEDAVVYLFDSAAIVVIKTEELTAADVLCLADLVVRVASLAPDRVSVVSRPY